MLKARRSRPSYNDVASRISSGDIRAVQTRCIARGCPVIGHPLTSTTDGKFIGKWLPPSRSSYCEWLRSYRGDGDVAASRVIANFHNQIGCLCRLSDGAVKSNLLPIKTVSKRQ
ncbi:hypothetical protein WN51_07948 [Melipona quadrifasciata]|uniref:Uncharacterized protein n=1 Tax=Melipona quadrifasciata TaxID=166423 RepID=A0A0M8ZP21_9HYME|nr:hypothetical protein WN51_07948 [Melipona quadrifasciata]